MKILVIDGQGGGVGKTLIAALKREMPTQPLIALGTNTQATAAMLKAGADQGATGENAIRYQCKSADIIVGVTGLLNANAMLGEVSPAIAMAISLSEAQKVLVPLEYLALMMPMTSKKQQAATAARLLRPKMSQERKKTMAYQIIFIMNSSGSRFKYGLVSLSSSTWNSATRGPSRKSTLERIPFLSFPMIWCILTAALSKWRGL